MRSKQEETAFSCVGMEGWILQDLGSALDHSLPNHITSFDLCASLSLSLSLMQACTESKGWTYNVFSQSFWLVLGHLSLIMCYFVSCYISGRATHERTG